MKEQIKTLIETLLRRKRLITHNVCFLSYADSDEKILLPNGVRLTFGEIIALAGDYYGIPDAPIANPLAPDHVDSGVAQRFHDAYSTLAHTPYEGEYKVWLSLKFPRK